MQHITPETIILLNKGDLVSLDKTESGTSAVWDRLRQLLPTVWTGSVLESEKGGMDAFMNGLVDVLKQRQV